MRFNVSGVAELSPHDRLATERELAVCPAARPRISLAGRPTRQSNAGAKAAPMRLHGLRPTARTSQKAPEIRRGNLPGFHRVSETSPIFEVQSNCNLIHCIVVSICNRTLVDLTNH
jgi:hypothetical protein